MGFSKSIQLINPDELEIFRAATTEYKQACRIYTPFRLAKDSPRATSEEIVAHEFALRVYRRECAKYHEARNAFAAAVRNQATKIPEMSNEDYMDLNIATNERALIQEERRNATLQAMGLDSEEALEDMRNKIDAARDKLQGKASTTSREEPLLASIDELPESVESEPESQATDESDEDEFSVFKKGA